jgi:ferredoxin
MFVHAHNPGNHGVAREVHHLRALGRGCGCCRSHCRDLAVVDDDGLVFERRRARAVNHADVLERHHQRIHRDKRRRARRQTALPHGQNRKKQKAERLHQGSIIYWVGML